MSRRNNRKKAKARNEFRYNKKTKHPAHVFEESNGKYRTVGITHEPTTFGKSNMPLVQNPKKDDPRKAYIRNGIISDSIRSFSKSVISNLSFSPEDFANVKSKERNYKKRRKKKGK